jgi:hypothetical protein
VFNAVLSSLVSMLFYQNVYFCIFIFQTQNGLTVSKINIVDLTVYQMPEEENKGA